MTMGACQCKEGTARRGNLTQGLHEIATGGKAALAMTMGACHREEGTARRGNLTQRLHEIATGGKAALAMTMGACHCEEGTARRGNLTQRLHEIATGGKAALAMTEVRILDGRRAPSVCCFFRNSIHPISRYKYDGILVREMGCCSGYGFLRSEANRNVCGCAKRRMQFADGGITPRPSSRGHRADRRAGCRQACRTSPARSYRSCGH